MDLVYLSTMSVVWQGRPTIYFMDLPAIGVTDSSHVDLPAMDLVVVSLAAFSVDLAIDLVASGAI